MSEFECLAWLTNVSALAALFSEGATTSGPEISRSHFERTDRSLSVLLQTTFGFTNVSFLTEILEIVTSGNRTHGKAVVEERDNH